MSGLGNNSNADAIAIIGIGCRFPAGANGPDAFWRLLREGKEAITEIPPGRFDIEPFYDPRPSIPGKIYTRWGGFLDQADQFDPSFFSISPREAAGMDPQHRLLLEVAWEALEDAGQVPGTLAGSRGGVFVGMITNDYSGLVQDPADIDIYFAAGNARSVASGRLSYAFGLEGPSLTVDTACSSSLVAVHLACQSLLKGESSLCLAAGVNLVLLPEPSIGFCQAQMLARDGHCKAFDARGDGFVRGDGVGVVVLKPLAAALADQDPIYAVIVGSAVNNDGRGGGFLMTPRREGHEAVLREAYRSAGISPGQVQYVETHGTGTSVGDPIEALALGTVLAENRSKNQPCIIGSVKTNIGHTEGAAGIAGLIKTALCLKHRALPPSLHFQEPNPHIPWQDLPLVVQREFGPWPVSSGPAIAGVSSLGISGTNAHIVLQEAPQTNFAIQHVGNGTKYPQSATRNPQSSQLLPLSARSPEALKDLARAYRDLLSTQDSPGSLRDICYTASVRRSHHDYRLALVGHSQEEFAEHAEAFLQDELRPGMSWGRKTLGPKRKVVFVFPGQGSQWAGMGRDLLQQEPVFREALERCDKAMRPYVDWSLLQQLTTDNGTHGRLDEVDVIQPAIFAMQVGLTALWRCWGVEPDAVVGQSMGEVAAAHIAGALSLEDAARIICLRSRIVKRTIGQGAMASVELSIEEAQRALAGYEDRVSIAVSSSPSSTVLSGDPAALKEILDRLEQQGVFCRFIKVEFASHSPQMDPLRPELLRVLKDVRPRSASVPIYSTVSGQVSDGAECDANYWVRNLREPVLFSGAVQQLLNDGHDMFVEISPHPILLPAIRQGMHHLSQEGIALPSLRREEGERAVMLGSLGELYTAGCSVDWSKFYPQGGQCVSLPSYPWQHERFWLESQESAESKRKGRRRHLLDQHVQSAAQPGTHFWEMELGTQLFSYLDDHRVQGLAVLPASAYLEMALAAAVEAFGNGPHVLEKVNFKKALFLPEDGVQTVQLVISPQTMGEVIFQFFSHGADSSAQQQRAPWTLHATGTIRLGQENPAASALEHEQFEDIRARCLEEDSGANSYRALEERGFQYGPSFQGIEQLWWRDGEALGRLRLPEIVQRQADAYQIHPALLDACFQVLAKTLPKGDSRGTKGEGLFLPTGLDQLRVYRPPGTELWSHALLRTGPEQDADTLIGDIFLLNDSGEVVLEARGFCIQRLDRVIQFTAEQDLKDWFYEIQWHPKPLPGQEQNLAPLLPEQKGSWLIFTDSRGVGQTLKKLLEGRGESCILVSPGEEYAVLGSGLYQVNPTHPDDFRRLLADSMMSDRPLRGIVHAWSLEAVLPQQTTLSSLEADERLGPISALYVVQALAESGRTKPPKLWLVTAGSQAVGENIASVSIAQAPLWGLGKTISLEHPELRCTRVDLSPALMPEELHSLFHELWSEDGENEIALRGDARHVARLTRYAPESREQQKLLVSRDESFRLEASPSGILDDLTLRKTTRRQPGQGEVEIHVHATGLNFLDVLSALGMVPGFPGGSAPLGVECTGKISAVGEGVEDFREGDEVIALASNSFASYVTIPALFVVRKPVLLSFAEAATIPAAFLTAHYALNHIGRMRKGERVLIHAAAGGVGQAAVQLARRVGAEIFATVGSAEKREFLQAQGIAHIMDSRSLTFADEVMERTNGEGVDIVLNSLAGEAIPKGLSILRPFGRFLEIGKRDIYGNSQLGLFPFQKNLSFSAIDLARMFGECPDFVHELLCEVVQFFADGTLKPLSVQVFPISDAASAFRHMAQAKHIGKIVVSVQEDEVMAAPALEQEVTFHADGTYLMTGGLGGLGLSVAQWMVERGARHLVLMGRSGAASVEAQKAVELMEKAGVQVSIARADVADEQQVAAVLRDTTDSMPPLRGVIHAAAVLDDGILLQLNEDRFKTVMAPKINGAWNLHVLTLNTPLDFFVLFSSGVSVFGSPGQGNYVAASAFLDALAHHRRALGLPAQTINWGAWAEVGLAARSDRIEHLAHQGIIPFSPRQGMQLMEQILQQNPAQVAAIAVDWGKLLSGYYPPLFSELAKEVNSRSTARKKQKDGLTQEKLLAVEPEQRVQLLESYLREQLSKVLRLSVAKIDVHQPLNNLGIDSLMAVELKNRVESDLEMALPVTALLQGPSLAQLAAQMLDQMALSDSTLSMTPHMSHDAAQELLAKVDQLSDEEVDALLGNMANGGLSEIMQGSGNAEVVRPAQ